ncbi:hypothetical protein VP1G_04469 [Cytospora mali]|uniref:DUF7707 domain-containing protein n=1 Tax=Cytospora mali TaxID=578113 RepID=A0A194UZM7_CYTMA|nr:hypothetical protein VP1G_04469 [Valsa mali var. pyri (nom. inval.)]
MPSLRTSFLAAAAALVATVQADYYIQPDSVPLATRQGWCASETSICPSICEDQAQTGAKVNTCNAESLSYGCLCSDGTTPNVSEYSLTLPYFVCTEWGNQCVTACGQNNTCSAACRDDHPCGAQHPKTYNTTATAASTTASSTADSTAVYTGPAGQTGSSSASRSPSFEMARLYSTAAMLGLFSLGFAYLL